VSDPITRASNHEHRFGSVVGITPMTPAAREWIDEHCQTDPWQWLGLTLNVDCRYAADILQGMADDGLILA
jgi:hypothetical protein